MIIELRWIKWINFCIKTTRFSILVNGKPVGFFPAERGLMQGDPLSPFLSTLAMEGQDMLRRVSAQNNWIKGFSLMKRANDIMEQTHILYADDTMVICEAKQEQICYLRAILVVLRPTQDSR